MGQSQFTIEDDEEKKPPKRPASGSSAFSIADDDAAPSSAAAGASDDEEPTTETMPGMTQEGIDKAKSAGVKFQKPTKLEKETPKIEENYGFSPLHMIGQAYEGAKGAIGSTIEGAKDALFSEGKNAQGEEQHGLGGLVGMNAEGKWDPTARINHLTQKYITDPAVAQWDKGNEEGGVAGAGHKLAAAIPIVGPFAADLGEQAGTGDVGGAGAKAVGATAGAEASLHPIETLKGAGAVLDKGLRGTPITEAGKLEAAKKQALTVKKPSMSETEYAGKVEAAMPDLQRVAQDNAGKVKDPRTAARAVTTRIQQMEAPISQHIQTLTAPEDMVHPADYHDQINEAVDREFGQAKHAGQMTAEEIEKAKGNVDKFIGDQPKTLAEIEGNRKRLNKEAEDYFSSRPADKRSMDASDAKAIAQKAAANSIRDLLYGDTNNPGLLEKAGVTAVNMDGQQVPMREFRQRVGNLIEVRDHFEDAITRAEAAGDWKAFDVAKKGPSLAAGGIGTVAGGLAGGPMGAILGTLMGEGGKIWSDYRASKNPNLNVQKMFRNLEAVKTPPNTLDVQTRTPIHQYGHAIGPQMPASIEPMGPQLPAEVRGPQFEQGAVARPNPNASQLWNPQVGMPPDLTWGDPATGGTARPVGDATYGPTSQPQPIGPGQPPAAPVQGPQGAHQMPLDLPAPPESAPLFSIQQTAEAKPPAGAPPAAPAPESLGEIGQIGGPRTGTLGKIGEAPKKGGITVGEGQDLGPGLGIEHILEKDGKRIGSVSVEPRPEGELHVHWLGGDIGRAGIKSLMEDLKEQYPDTEKVTYDRRRLAKGADAATTEAREIEVPINKPSDWNAISGEIGDALREDQANKDKFSGNTKTEKKIPNLGKVNGRNTEGGMLPGERQEGKSRVASELPDAKRQIIEKAKGRINDLIKDNTFGNATKAYDLINNEIRQGRLTHAEAQELFDHVRERGKDSSFPSMSPDESETAQKKKSQTR